MFPVMMVSSKMRAEDRFSGHPQCLRHISRQRHMRSDKTLPHHGICDRSSRKMHDQLLSLFIHLRRYQLLASLVITIALWSRNMHPLPRSMRPNTHLALGTPQGPAATHGDRTCGGSVAQYPAVPRAAQAAASQGGAKAKLSTGSGAEPRIPVPGSGPSHIGTPVPASLLAGKHFA